MGWSYKIDPITRDLIPDGRGSFVRVETAETSIQIALRAHHNECWHDPDLGSELHDLERFQADPPGGIADEVRRALGPLERAGRIADLEVVAVETQPGRIEVRTRSRDQTTNQLIDITIKAGG